jgi:uncharacterized membrane protein YfcA
MEPVRAGECMNPLVIVGGLALGLVIGAISGVVGIGGGAFLIPALIFFFGMSQIRAQGTSIATLLLPIGIFAFLTYYKAGHVDVKLAMILSVGFAVGGWLGGMWAQHLPEIVLKRAFGVLLLSLGVKMLFLR